MRIEKESIVSFINYNYTPIKKKQVFTRVLLSWGLSVIIYLINQSLIVILFTGNVLVTGYATKLISASKITLKQQNLFVGIQSINLSVILVVVSYRFAILNSKDNMPLLLILLALIVVNIGFLFVLVFHLIKKGAYNREASNNTSITRWSFIGSFSGFIAARLFINDTSQDPNAIFLSVMLMIIAFLENFESMFLLKYLLQVYLEEQNKL